MSFQGAEQGVQTSRPVELFIFQLPNAYYSYTGFSRDVNYFGITFKAVAGGCKRGALSVVSGIENIPQNTVELPATDPVVVAYAGVGLPPQSMIVTCYRLQYIDGTAQQLFTGFVQSCSFRSGANKRTAVLGIATTMDQPLSIQIPKVVVSRYCNHVLYDPLCGQSRASNLVNATILSLNGSAMTISTTGGAGITAFVYGDIVHVPTQDRRTTIAQNGTAITMDAPWNTNAQVGDPVQMFLGCDHTVQTCFSKFNNVVNFGGMPALVSANYFWSDIRRTGKT